MGEILLIRHGQANSAAHDEASYDRLSDLGHRQSAWLGDWLAENEGTADHVLSGTLRRHRETVAGLRLTADEDPRLNEIDYFRLSDAYLRKTGAPRPGPDDYADHMPRVFEAWHRAEIAGTETFEAFQDRVAELLDEAAIPGRRLVCVTSGGVIGMVLRHLLDLDLLRMSRVMLPIFNTSLHRIHVTPRGPILAGFNAIPHLESPDRARARTYY